VVRAKPSSDNQVPAEEILKCTKLPSSTFGECVLLVFDCQDNWVEAISQRRNFISLPRYAGSRHPDDVYFDLKLNNLYLFQIKNTGASVNPFELDMSNKRLVIGYHVTNSDVENITLFPSFSSVSNSKIYRKVQDFI
jgi:hypothetical protein